MSFLEFINQENKKDNDEDVIVDGKNDFNFPNSFEDRVQKEIDNILNNSFSVSKNQRDTFLSSLNLVENDIHDCRMTELNEMIIEFEKNNEKISTIQSELINMKFTDFDSIFNYDLSYTRNTIDKLDINLGSDDIPRISCANHKLNLCVCSAVVKHPIF